MNVEKYFQFILGILIVIFAPQLVRFIGLLAGVEADLSMPFEYWVLIWYGISLSIITPIGLYLFKEQIRVFLGGMASLLTFISILLLWYFFANNFSLVIGLIVILGTFLSVMSNILYWHLFISTKNRSIEEVLGF